MLKTFEKKINLIEGQVEEVFSRLVKANTISLAGLTEKDLSRFKEARNCLSNVDETCDAIDNNVITALALFSPEAKDLRKLVSYLKITSSLHKTAQNIKSYNKVLAKNFEEYEQIFNSNKALILLQEAALKALQITQEIVFNNDEDSLEDLYHQITKEVDRTESAFEEIEQELLKNLTSESFAAHTALLKTFRKLDKVTSRAMDISSTLLCAKLNKLPLPLQ